MKKIMMNTRNLKAFYMNVLLNHFELAEFDTITVIENSQLLPVTVDEKAETFVNYYLDEDWRTEYACRTGATVASEYIEVQTGELRLVAVFMLAFNEWMHMLPNQIQGIEIDAAKIGRY